MEALLQRRNGLRVVIVLIAILGVLVGYYWQHKALSPAVIASLGGMAVDFLTAVTIAVIAGGVGRRLLASINLAVLSRPERTALECLLGLGVISLVVVLLGLIGLFKGIVLWPLLLISGVLTLRSLIGWLADLSGVVNRIFHPATSWAGFLTVLIGLTLFG